MRDRKSDTAHRRAAERKLGRPLQLGELVHHVNESKDDQSHANLDVTSRSIHTTLHNRTRPLSRLRAALRQFKEGRKTY